MIASLRGRLVAKEPERVVVDVGGVGFEVFISLQAFASLPAVGAPIELYVHTHVREDALQLFGFLDQLERDLFHLLRGVAGIGPRLALTILSGLPARELAAALCAGDVARLVAVPGVGRKTAERMVVELRERARVLAAGRGDGRGRRHEVAEEAVSALVNLGYRRSEAERAVERAGVRASLEELIREALRSLGA